MLFRRVYKRFFIFFLKPLLHYLEWQSLFSSFLFTCRPGKRGRKRWRVLTWRSLSGLGRRRGTDAHCTLVYAPRSEFMSRGGGRSTLFPNPARSPLASLGVTKSHVRVSRTAWWTDHLRLGLRWKDAEGVPSDRPVPVKGGRTLLQDPTPFTLSSTHGVSRLQQGGHSSRRRQAREVGSWSVLVSFLCVSLHSLSEEALLLIMCGAAVKRQMIYWKPNTQLQQRTFLSLYSSNCQPLLTAGAVAPTIP